MMTCVSERSGTASSDVRKRAAMPNPAAISTPMTVNKRCRAQRAIRRSIMSASPFLCRRAQLALGPDQEVARRHHEVACFEPAQHFVETIGALSELNFARRQTTIAEI